jgi:dUTP pyrophosphatase
MTNQAKRGFEVISAYQTDQEIQLPRRSTTMSAGYDIAAAEDIVVPAMWKTGVKYVLKDMAHLNVADEADESAMKPVLVPTGLKAFMGENEYLQLTCRSSNPLKRGLSLPNGVGIVDADYYNNEGNEGHLFVQLVNFGLRDVHIKKGERIAQGIFLSFLTTSDDQPLDQVRSGGFGSSGK